MKYRLYKTDYFTHRVIEKVLDNLGTNLQLWEMRDAQKGYLRTSLGVNIIIRIPKDGIIILVRRSKQAAYNNAGKIYPTVVETVDLIHDDFTSYYPNPIIGCIMRGMEEELGIPDIRRPRDDGKEQPKLYVEEDIRLRSMFYTVEYRQDNVFAIVSLKDDITMENLRECIAHRATDYSLENRGAPIIIKDTPSEIETYIYNNHDNMIMQTLYCLNDYKWLLENREI